MSTVTPEGENLRKAVKWITEMRVNSPGTPEETLLEEAARTFNLTPLDAEFLARNLKTAQQ
jgi:hypothetical protein